MDVPAPARSALMAILVLMTTGPGCLGLAGKSAAPRALAEVLRASPDPNLRHAAYEKLSRSRTARDPDRHAEAVALLVAGLAEGKEPVATRAVICRSLGELGGPQAREALLKVVNDTHPVVRAEAARALGAVGQPEDATILARIMTVDTSAVCRIAAIDGLATLRPQDPRILQVLVSGMEHDDPAIRFASLEALKATTGEDFGVESNAWRQGLSSRLGPTSPTGANPAGPGTSGP